METKNIYKALADFQQEVPVIFKDTAGYGYNYADLPAIFTAINPLMKKYNLGFYQAVNNNEIDTVIFHSISGETIKSCTPIPQGVQLKGMNDFQVLGSAITYIKRYALSSLLGLVTDKDTDASGEQIKKVVKKENPHVADFEKDLEPTDEEVITWQEKLESAQTVKQLKEFWEITPPTVKDKLQKLKDDLKFKLS